jgi:hypothetical protein
VRSTDVGVEPLGDQLQGVRGVGGRSSSGESGAGENCANVVK